MQTARHILSTLLIVGILSTGLPFFNPEDAILSNKAMLEDAILGAQALARSAQDDGSFKTGMKKALSSLYIAAGLKTIIKKDINSKSVLNLSTLDSSCLISFYRFSSHSSDYQTIFELNIAYQSITNDIPPPLRASILLSERQ